MQNGGKKLTHFGLRVCLIIDQMLHFGFYSILFITFQVIIKFLVIATDWALTKLLSQSGVVLPLTQESVISEG